jgi:hypothetical protein
MEEVQDRLSRPQPEAPEREPLSPRRPRGESTTPGTIIYIYYLLDTLIGIRYNSMCATLRYRALSDSGDVEITCAMPEKCEFTVDGWLREM